MESELRVIGRLSPQNYSYLSFVTDKLLPLINNSGKNHNDNSYYHLLSNHYGQGTLQTFFQILTTTLKKKFTGFKSLSI